MLVFLAGYLIFRFLTSRQVFDIPVFCVSNFAVIEMNPVFVPEKSVTFLLQHEQQERMTILLHVFS